MPRQRTTRKLPRGIIERPGGKILAQAYDPASRRRIGKVFDRKELSAAKSWLRDTEIKLERGQLRPGEIPSLNIAASQFMLGIADGTIRSRSGQRYRPSTIRRYKLAFEKTLLPELGHLRLSDIRPGQLAALIGDLQARGFSASSVRNTLVPLQALYRWAMRRELVSVVPTRSLPLPADHARRERIASPEEADLLLATLDPRDQPLWATAFYAGLRRGELLALRWGDVDLVENLIRVERAYNPETGTLGPPKSAAGKRRVPIIEDLRRYLEAHRGRGRDISPESLVFARSSLGGRQRGPDGYFSPSGIAQRAEKRWRNQGVDPIGLHEARHTFASLMIAAGVNAKALSTYMGHSTIAITLDRYGHLFPGNEVEVAGQLQAYLDRERAGV